MNLSYALLNFSGTLLYTVLSCIIPFVVGIIYLSIAKKNKKDKRKAPLLALIPESIIPAFGLWFGSDSVGTMLFLSFCFIGYIPKRQKEDNSVKIDFLVNSLKLIATAFMWCTAIRSRYYYYYNWIWCIISILFVFVLKLVAYLIERRAHYDINAKAINGTPNADMVQDNKSKTVAALLAFFLGSMGVHRYYLGYKKQGVVQSCGFVSVIIGYAMYILAIMDGETGLMLLAALFLLFGGGTGIWAFVDFIRILTGGLIPQNGSYYTDNYSAQVRVVQNAPSAVDVYLAKGSSYTENQHTQVDTVQNVPSTVDNIDVLEKLAKLHEQGILSDEEFQQKKMEILTKI